MKTKTKKQEVLETFINPQTKAFILSKFRTGKNARSGDMDATGRSYSTAIKMLEDFIKEEKGFTDEKLKDYSFFDLSFADLESFSYYLNAVRGNSPSTHNHRMTIVSAFITYLLNRYHDNMTDAEEVRLERLKKNIKKDLRQDEPTVETPFFTAEEIGKLHRYILTISNPNKRKRLLAMFLLYRDTADRKDEVRNFVLSDIHFSDIEGHSYAITPYKNKTLTEKKHYLKEDTVKALKDYLEIRNPKNANEQSIFLSNFRTPITSNATYDMLKNLFIRAGFGYIDDEGNEKTKYVVHSLRHSSITETCRLEGIHAAKIKAGHSSITMTQNYSHTTDEDRRQTATLAFEYTV